MLIMKDLCLDNLVAFCLFPLSNTRIIYRTHAWMASWPFMNLFVSMVQRSDYMQDSCSDDLVAFCLFPWFNARIIYGTHEWMTLWLYEFVCFYSPMPRLYAGFMPGWPCLRAFIHPMFLSFL